MRLADLTAGPLSAGQERKKQKSNLALCFEFSPHLIDSRYNQPQSVFIVKNVQTTCVSEKIMRENYNF